jgi:hypothetical protein
MIEVIGSYDYQLNTPPGIHDVFHSQLLRPALDDPLPSQVQDDSQPPPALINNEEEYDIKEILDEKLIGRKR